MRTAAAEWITPLSPAYSWPVLTRPTIDPHEFIDAVQPLLERRDAAALRDLLHQRWTLHELLTLFSCDSCDARKVAGLALALVGSRGCVRRIAAQLRDDDPMVNQMAEHALWSIWLRLGSPEANHELCRGSAALQQQDFPKALAHFTRAADLCPTFAEAYNQRAIAHYLREDYDASAADCLTTLSLMPNHFGAWAGLGHCHAHLGRIPEAIVCYEKALAINPHLDSLRQALDELHIAS